MRWLGIVVILLIVLFRALQQAGLFGLAILAGVGAILGTWYLNGQKHRDIR